MASTSKFIFTKMPGNFGFQKFMYKVYSIVKHPSLIMAGASLCRFQDEDCIKIPHTKRNNSFLDTMAFGPILTGAETAAYFPFAKHMVVNGMYMKAVVKSGTFDIQKPVKSDLIFKPENLDIEKVFTGDWVRKSYVVSVNAYDSDEEVVAEFTFKVVLKKA